MTPFFYVALNVPTYMLAISILKKTKPLNNGMILFHYSMVLE